VTISSWLNIGRLAPRGRGSAVGWFFGSSLLQPARSVCASLSFLFHLLAWDRRTNGQGGRLSVTSRSRSAVAVDGWWRYLHTGVLLGTRSFIRNVYNQPVDDMSPTHSLAEGWNKYLLIATQCSDGVVIGCVYLSVCLSVYPSINPSMFISQKCNIQHYARYSSTVKIWVVQ